MKRLTGDELAAALREAFPVQAKLAELPDFKEAYGGVWSLHTPRDVRLLLRIPGAVRLCLVMSGQIAYGGDSGWLTSFPTTRTAVRRLMRNIVREEGTEKPVQVHACYYPKTRTLEIGS